MRAFVAIPIDETLRVRIGDARKALERADADVKWVAHENLHLTLKFLGEIKDAQAATLRERLRTEAARFPALDLNWTGVGRFPPGGPPRILWIGCRGDAPKLVGLAGAVERAALEIGVPKEDRPFSAHLTIGRVKSQRNQKRLLNALEARNDDGIGEQRADSFTLYRSTLTPAGPIYDEVELFRLGL